MFALLLVTAFLEQQVLWKVFVKKKAKRTLGVGEY